MFLFKIKLTNVLLATVIHNLQEMLTPSHPHNQIFGLMYIWRLPSPPPPPTSKDVTKSWPPLQQVYEASSCLQTPCND